MTRALAVVTSGCASSAEQQEQIAQLREDLEAREGIERALATRVDELEGNLAALREAEEQDRSAEHLDAVDEELARLSDLAASLETDLTTEVGDREALAEELRTNVSDLRAGLVALEGSVEELRGQVDELQALYGSLRDRVDRLQRGG